ncbi:MAG: hypothetical protein EXR92_04650 [Gemmatimonadetes bacterium]|nr:hypothetical protein [Gemmatimonadota bacterium]
MRRVDEAVAAAPAGVCFEIASDVEGWPEILPHYRWVRFRKRHGPGRGLVEMAAWRPFRLLRWPLFRWPTWWVSEMESNASDRTVRYRHIEGITEGMDVLWEIRAEGNGHTRLRIVHDWEGPRWPPVGGLVADMVIGPGFVSHIARRTLAGVVREAEARAGVVR